MSADLTRRGLLRRGLVALPLIGGGVTLIGQAAAHVPLAQVAAAPLLDSPEQRARYAWAAFAAAMREVSAGSDGWFIRGGEQVRAVGYMPVRAPWLVADAVNLVPIERSVGGLADRMSHLFAVQPT